MTTVEEALAIETMQGGPLWIHSVGDMAESSDFQIMVKNYVARECA